MINHSITPDSATCKYYLQVRQKVHDNYPEFPDSSGKNGQKVDKLSTSIYYYSRIPAAPLFRMRTSAGFFYTGILSEIYQASADLPRTSGPPSEPRPPS